MLANMAASLIMNKRIATTEAKAKALRTYVEPLITKSKIDSTHSRRVIFSHLQNKVAVAELFREVSPKVGDRPGGYTRILKTGTRFGDNADMCIIELVDFNENMLVADESKAKGTRRRRSPKKKSETAAVAQKAEKKSVEAKAPVADDTAQVVEESSPGADTINEAGNEIEGNTDEGSEEAGNQN